MLKRILLYSFAAIFLGIVVMLLPLILYLPMLASTTMQQALPATEESGKASRTLSLSEAAQIYGKNDIAVGGKGAAVFSTLNILIPLLLVFLAGLLAALVVRIIAGEKLGLQLES